MTTDNFCFYLQNRLIQTSQTGGQWYSDTSPFSIPCTRVPVLPVSNTIAYYGTVLITFVISFKKHAPEVNTVAEETAKTEAECDNRHCQQYFTVKPGNP